MPDMDGIEATRHIRNKQSSIIDHDVPIIAMTAHAMKGDKERCIEAGMTDYISKPIHLRSLTRILENWAGTFNENEITDTSFEENVRETVIFDRRSFLENIVDDVEIARKIIDIFLRNTPKQLLALKEAIDKNEIDEIMIRAHSIKGSSISVGGVALSNIAAKLEQEAIADGLDDNTKEELTELEKQYELLIEELKKL